VVSQILGRTGANPATAPVAAAASGTPNPTAALPPVGAVLPSVPAQVPPGWSTGGTGAGYGGTLGRNTGNLNAGQVNPNLTPDQAYAQYLQQRGFADQSTPAGAASNAVLYAQQQLNYVDPFGPNRNGLTYDPYQQTLRTNLQQQILNFNKASPYAYTYGSPAAHAPAPAPQYGYPAGYGQPAPGWQPQSNPYGGGFAGPGGSAGGAGFGATF